MQHVIAHTTLENKQKLVTGLSVRVWHRLNETQFQYVDQLQKKQLNVSLMMVNGTNFRMCFKTWLVQLWCLQQRGRGRGRRVRDCECLMETLIILRLGGFLPVGWRESWLQIFFYFVLKCASYSFDCFIYSVNRINAAQTGQKKGSACMLKVWL